MKIFGWAVVHPDGCIAAGAETRHEAIASFARDYFAPAGSPKEEWKLAQRNGCRVVKICEVRYE